MTAWTCARGEWGAIRAWWQAPGSPLVVLAGLVPQAGVARGPMRVEHERTAKLFAQRPRGLLPQPPPGDAARDHDGRDRSRACGRDAGGVRRAGGPARDVHRGKHRPADRSPAPRCRQAAGAGQHRLPARVRRRSRLQRRVAARVRAGALHQACAVFAADLAPSGPLALLAGSCRLAARAAAVADRGLARHGDDGRGRG